MDLATGAMGSLLSKLFELLKEEYKLQTGVKKDVEFLHREMESMGAALRKVAAVPRDRLDEQVKIWADQVRELSYEMEDLVDSFLVRVEGSTPVGDPDSFKGLMKKMANLFKKGKTRHEIADAIKDIKDQVQEVAARRDRYKIDEAGANPSATTTIDPRMLSLFKDRRELIGIDEPRDEIIKMLVYGDAGAANSGQQLKMLSIFGFGGLGKTTLAKAAYDKLPAEQFVAKAFVSVGQNPSLKKVFMDILRQLDEESWKNATMLDEGQLIGELRGLLQNKRYVIVIDDIWDMKSWEMIRCACVDSNYGSIIITTTRIFKVAKEIDGHVYQHKPLSDDNARELFFKRLSISNGKPSYVESIEISEKILQKCDGVPLAIITVASLLANKPRDDWSQVYESIGFGKEDNVQVENTRKILKYSYYDLPCHLRTCLLYLSVFPEDYEIRKEHLIWKWVAEGFIDENHASVELFELGEIYFNELINRSMIQPIEWPSIGIVSHCRVHDLVLDMVRSLSKEEKFIVVLDSDEQQTCPQSNARRIALQKRVIDQGNFMANTVMYQMRSYNATMCHVGMIPSLLSFHGLRVLDFEKCTFMKEGSYHLEHLGKLLQLRYLGLCNTPITELPSDIGNLKFLQALDLTDTGIRELPQSVGLLRQLKCLHLPCNFNFTGVLNWIGNLTSLQQLILDDVSPEIVEELGKLTELRVLYTEFANSIAEFSDLMECLGNLQKLQVIQVNCRMEPFEWANCGGYAAPRHLRELALYTIKFARLPAWIDSSRLPHLSHLNLRVDTMEARDVEILGNFPELITLTMRTLDHVFVDIMGGGAFPKLRYFSTDAMLYFLEGAMPILEHVEYQCSTCEAASLENDIASIGNLRCLEKVEVEMRCGDLDDVAEEALRHAVEIHPKRPTLLIS